MNEEHLPDYSDSILSLASSVLHHYGVTDCSHPTQPLLDRMLQKDPRNVVVMLFDGMGINLLEHHLPADSFLRTHLAAPISSVFPPTTVAATTTIQTGLSPAEHGWLGWSLYFKEVQANVDTFSNRISATGKKAGPENLAEKYLPHKTIYERIMTASPDVDAEQISMRSRIPTFSVASSCARTLRLARRPGKHYIYCYWINPDHLAHQHGIDSRQVHRNILRINHEVEAMCRKIPDAVVTVIADHGMIDTKWLYLEDHPELCELLSRDPSVESRAVSLSVKSGMQEVFRQRFTAAFGSRFRLMTHAEVLAGRLFGEGVVHPRIEEFLGDFLAVSVSGYSLSYHRRRHELIGMHAGMTKEELTVPLILIDCTPNR
jgi:hypothetical protein